MVSCVSQPHPLIVAVCAPLRVTGSLPFAAHQCITLCTPRLPMWDVVGLEPTAGRGPASHLTHNRFVLVSETFEIDPNLTLTNISSHMSSRHSTCYRIVARAVVVAHAVASLHMPSHRCTCRCIVTHAVTSLHMPSHHRTCRRIVAYAVTLSHRASHLHYIALLLAFASHRVLHHIALRWSRITYRITSHRARVASHRASLASHRVSPHLASRIASRSHHIASCLALTSHIAAHLTAGITASSATSIGALLTADIAASIAAHFIAGIAARAH